MLGRKIEPVRVQRPSFDQLPSLAEIVQWAEREEWLLFEVPDTEIVGEDRKRSDSTKTQRERLTGLLMSFLPSHAVWDSGFLPDEASLPAARAGEPGSRITGMARFSIRRLVSEAEVEEHRDLLIRAMTEYRTLANELIRRLATQLEVDVAEFAATKNWRRHEKYGSLGEDDWNYFFHGYDCAFRNPQTEVRVESRLGWGLDFGVFDPYFLLNFMKGQAEFAPLVELFRDWMENVRFALRLMERRGIVRVIELEYTRGWVLASPLKR